jgi:uroporphyrinogen-III synthase
MRLVVTRPLSDAERTASILRGRGHEVLVAPLMRVEPVAADLSGNWSAVTITSANALAHTPVAPLHNLPLFAVGSRSAQAAREAGFADVASADGDARDLVRLIASRRPANLLYLAGEDRAADLVGELKARGIAAELRVVYRAVTAPFPDALIAALNAGEVDGVLHFSRRSAENFVAGARAAGVAAAALAARHYCLSAQVAEPLAAAGAKAVLIAARPDESALIELLGAPPG